MALDMRKLRFMTTGFMPPELDLAHPVSLLGCTMYIIEAKLLLLGFGRCASRELFL
jgi:hypothetical protein